MNRIKLNKDLYKKLYLIRRSEKSICKYYPEDDMKTPMHMSMGEEAIVVGVCHALNKQDQIFATYRSHGAFIAKTQNTDDFFAELYAKDTSLIKGKGGSMHLCSPKFGFMGSSAIVASHISVGVGASFTNKFHKNNKIVVIFFGDGATDEGAFWESINIASLMELPVIFVCEDNGFAVHTTAKARRSYTSITQIISKFNYHVFESKSTNVEEIYNLTKETINRIRNDNKPCFMNLKYYRYLEHVGINDDFNNGYRSKVEYDKWLKKDPVKLQREKLLGLNITNIEIKKIENEIDNKIIQSITLAKKAPLSSYNELYNEVFK